MHYSVKSIAVFERQAKRLIKKYPSLKTELAQLIQLLKKSPEQQGTSLGNSCYKIRMSIASKGKGKSGGARVITHLQILQSTVFLLSIYDKSEQTDISDSELKDLLKLLQ
ncbi:type II toxin-antitoxin system RelE/ParE family toxin [Ferruginibacter sp.]